MKMEGSEGKKANVLVVEDEWWIAEMITGILENAGYCVVGPADSVQTGLALIENHQIDAALLDVNLGTAMSYPIADALIARDVPMLLTTGYHYKDLPRQYHGVPLLGKPTTPQRILAALTQLLKAD
ncbi:response regulator [Novosphingobium sp. P6W]|uniref:response regulator n=1 Tax=Novosphingobium sp. P6W TaxID=1609758 RepID=UPI000696D825|nr:response regulator [Novosphingobium sp. P6W]